MGRVWKLSETLSYGSRLETQRNAFLWVAFGNSAKRFPMGRVWKLSETLPMGRVSGSYRIFVKSKDNVVKSNFCVKSPFGDYHMMKNVFL
ncbi:hypothetical protein BV917_05345 [Leptospira santarosai serovar Guaricura]|uniref:hypothetical protein n=2 Tax=Leptospira santarosai TaxID=28183 RepID=UPI000959443F|nr:hypothetical protein [Leptospira santarosai]OLY61420.1 hypothetical protein BV917_05345 [Leptospira santarosai serovar Guaricura]